jgi:hypothetical protein
MDNSTEGVTLYTGFIAALLDQYKGRERTCAQLFGMAKDLDLKNPTKPAPMALYNEMCDWIEKKLGSANIRRSGRAIGNEAYGQMVADRAVDDTVTPQQILEQLRRVAALMIQDPKGRGWEIVEMGDRRALMRRTQTFNCMLQEGLLFSLVERTGVLAPRVEHVKCTRSGDEYCDYEVTWLPPP